MYFFLNYRMTYKSRNQKDLFKQNIYIFLKINLFD